MSESIESEPKNAPAAPQAEEMIKSELEVPLSAGSDEVVAAATPTTAKTETPAESSGGISQSTTEPEAGVTAVAVDTGANEGDNKSVASDNSVDSESFERVEAPLADAMVESVTEKVSDGPSSAPSSTKQEPNASESTDTTTESVEESSPASADTLDSSEKNVDEKPASSNSCLLKYKKHILAGIILVGGMAAVGYIVKKKMK